MNPLMRWLNLYRRTMTLVDSRRRFTLRQRGKLQCEALEERCVPAVDFRAIDGLGNNAANSNWGQAGSNLIRIAPAAYANGLSAPAGDTTRPSGRAISNLLSDQIDPTDPTEDLNLPNEKQFSAFIYGFGQFLDHDIDLTTTTSGVGQSFPIDASQSGDPFNPPGIMSFTRSTFDTGTGTTNAREQVNAVTSFLDGSQIYGSDAARADALRTHSRGKLKTSTGNLLPFNNGATFPSGTLTMANDAHLVADDKLFAAGDVRANENIELTAMQTLFVREHNRIADQLHYAHPSWDDDKLYQEARRIVGAELQIITYNEYLPALLGPNALPAYTGYKANVNPGIANEFSTSLFRFAHSQLDNDVERFNNDGTAAAGELSLAQAFFNPTLVNPNGVLDPISGQASTDIDELLKYLASTTAQEVDLPAVSAIRNFLFGPPGAGGSDLIARDIQRGRDHGLTDYNSMRVAYGLPRVTTFAQISSDLQVQQKLQQLYGTLDNIDSFIGAVAEDHVAGVGVGPLVKAVLVDQFTRLRAGDRYFYLNQFSPAEVNDLLCNTSLAEIIERNTDITNLQNNVFFFKSSISGDVYSYSRDGYRHSYGTGLAGVTVQLLNDEGDVVDTTVTDNKGRYRFDVLETGEFDVRVVVPAGLQQVAADPDTILISRGDKNVRDVDFKLASTTLILDDGDAGFGTSGGWTTASGQGFDNDVRYTAAGAGGQTSTWSFPVTPGLFRVSATWTPYANRATNAPFTILDGTKVLDTVRVNEQVAPADATDAGARWKYLGASTYVVTGSTLTVRLSNQANGVVVADAIRVENLGSLAGGPEIQVLDAGSDLTSGTSSINFGTAVVGAPVQHTFTVRNLGLANLTVTRPISVPAGFSVASSFGSTSLAPGASTTFTIQLNAASPGTYGGTVTFATNDSNESPFTFAVSGSAQAAPSVQIIDDGNAAFASSGAWGLSTGLGFQSDVRYAAPGSGSITAAWTFAVTPGLYRVSATWTQSSNRASNAPFTVLDGSTPVVVTSVNQQQAPGGLNANGASWKDLSAAPVLITGTTLTVRLTNQANGYVIADAIRVERTGNILPNPSVQVQDGASAIASAATVNMGSTGWRRASKNFTIRNNGGAALNLSGLTIPAGFTLATGFGSPTLAPGAATTFSVQLTSSTINNFSGQVTFATNDPGNPTFSFTLTAKTILTIDNSSLAGFAAAGAWTNFTQGGFQGNLLYTAPGSGASTATWVFNLPAGNYRVATTWPAYSNRASNAPFTISDGSTRLGTVQVNQQQAPADFSDAGTTWKYLGGTWTINGSQLIVKLTNNANGYVIADAVRVERV